MCCSKGEGREKRLPMPMLPFATVTIEEAIVAFAAGPSTETRRSAAQAILSAKAQHQVAKSPEFQRGMNELRLVARGDGDPLERAAAVALLFRILAGQQKRPERAIGDDRVLVESSQEIARFEAIADADDRKYAALGVAASRAPWAARWLARGIVRDEGGRSTKDACIPGLLALTPNLSEALTLIQDEWKQWTPETENPSDSLGKRLRRMLVELTGAVDLAVDLGEGFGECLDTLVRLRGGSRESVDPDVARGVAEASLGFLASAMRLRFSSATEAANYEALAALRGWFSPLGWLNFTRESDAAKRVVGHLADALRLLVRQGRGDDGLAAKLAELVGDERAMKVRARLADEGGVSPEMRNWLAARKNVRASEAESRAAEQGRASEELGAVAELLRDARAAEYDLRRAGDDLSGELGVVAPALKPRFERLVGRCTILVQSAVRLGAGRGLRIRGDRGAVVEYSPVEHQLLEGDQGTRRVRVVEPLVELARSDGRTLVVLKALATPARDE